MRQLLENLFLYEDTCNVYVLRDGTAALLVDFGAGDVLDHLREIGVESVAAVLMTHHHRDQAQGLPRAAARNMPIYVPHTEQDLFHSVDAHWQAREIYNNYSSRADRFSLLESVPVAGTLKDYSSYTFGSLTVSVLPTPGHTIGALSLLAELNGVRVAFTGDLIAAPGQVWNMAATQWTYNGGEGIATSVPSLLDVKERQPALLLPSHGAPMDDPNAAIDLLVERFTALLHLRGHNPRLLELHARPYEAITPHLLRHRASFANIYVLLSHSGKALLLDFGYDFATGDIMRYGNDRGSRRPWLHTIPTLKAQFGISKIDVVMPTHFHDDHVAGINLLRDAEGTQHWASELFADILEQPATYDLPCIWYDPIPVDRRVPLETPVQWEEYTITQYALPGHTRYAVAIAVEVDGNRVLVTGDQYAGGDGTEFNYVYPNRFEAADYVKSAALYRRLNPDLILTGHWEPLWVTPVYFDTLDARGAALEALHNSLLPETPNLGADGWLARITPYQPTIQRGATVEMQVEVLNPFTQPANLSLEVIVPQGWQAKPATIAAALGASSHQTLKFSVTTNDTPLRRARIAVDVTIDGRRFGQAAEALITTL